MLMCDKTVTLYHPRYDEDADMDVYDRTVIRGASWYAKSTIALDEKGVKAANVVKSRVPEKNMPLGCVPRKGDYLALGEQGDIEKPADLDGTESIQILTVGDNRRGGLPHWLMVGA